jgi:hypothetical protein
MPFFLAVPPTDHVSENAEVRILRESDAKKFREQQRKVIGGSAKVTAAIQKGAFRGTEVFEWDGTYNALLLTSFLYPTNSKTKAEWLRLVALIRQSDCVLMGASWEWRGEAPKGVPVEVTRGGEPLAKSKARLFEMQNSYRFQTSFVGRFGTRGSLLLELVGGEQMAAAGLPTVSSLGRNWCDATLTPEMKRVEKVEFPARAHRVLVGTWEEAKAKSDGIWPSAKGNFAVDAGTFGERKMLAWEQAKFEVFSPKKVADGIVAKLKPVTHKVTEAQFKVIKRQGRWVYLDRGRAYGLEIGTHLVARGATLHVLQYDPESQAFDVAIAMIRTEDAGAPLRAGDVVSFDLTKYPKKEVAPSR